MTTFPTIWELLQGALLNTIAYAIWFAADSLLANEVGWNGKNYLRQDSMGTSGAIHFADSATAVGAFFAHDSAYSPFANPGRGYDIERFLSGMPSKLHEIADTEVLPFLLQDYKGIVQPIITAAFWCSGASLTAAMPWSEIWAHGAQILKTELMPLDSVFEHLKANFELTSEQLALIEALFHKRRTELDSIIVLDDAEYRALVSQGNAGISETERLLNSINIRLPQIR